MPSALPRFSLSHWFTAQNARQDKIELEVGSWRLQGHQTLIDDVRERMTSPDRVARASGRYDASAYALLFNRPSDNQNRRPALCLRSQPLHLGEITFTAPLCAGEWVFTPYAQSDPQESTFTNTWLNLSLNPTRFVRHQREPTFLDQRPPYQPNHWVLNTQREFNGEYPLDGSDNWIPSGAWLDFASPRRWLTHLQFCFGGALNLFTDALHQAVHRANAGNTARRINPRRASIAMLPTETLNLKTCETYFEFASESPLWDVLRLEGVATEFSNLNRESRTYESLNHRERQIDHCKSITFQAGAGREVKIYAKTNRRVRIEVKHRMRGRKAFPLLTEEQPQGPRAPSRSHTADSHDAFYRFLRLLAQDAAGLLNQFFRYAESRSNSVPSQNTAFTLLQAIYAHSEDGSHAVILSQMLVYSGQIRANVFPDDLRVTLSNLESAGVLQRLRNILRRGLLYSVTPQYQEALLHLRQMSNAPCRVRVPRSSQQQPRVRTPPDDQTQIRVRRPPPQT